MPEEIRRVTLAHAPDLEPDVVVPLVRAMREAAATLAAEHSGPPR
ncbi:hypothetical protein DFR76_115232 [Nocardia pseudobrasiliensis]|uniref:Uncharacterized protein n=1 Tax=Nocardia pseudobrasiliensis TaxID=45979 RepID=A0A370HPV0_9NOCA|nr:hypothetical protein DFR76_115232 [Nocardia pseudobrasiliensis]